MNESGRHLFIVVAVALGTLLLLSLFPWGRMTGNRIKDFNLFEDLSPKKEISHALSEVKPDPELEEFMAETMDEEPSGLPTEEPADTFVAPPTEEPAPEIVYEEAPVADGKVLIEAYGAEAFPRLRKALASGSARIAVLGDSYIEGDIFTQDLRSMLQQEYGGSGVGYMNMHSEFPGFRKSVRQSDSGWEAHDIRTMASRDTIRLISNEYAIATAGARSNYKGTSNLPGNKSWNRSTFAFLAPADGTVTLTTAAGAQTFPVAASPLPQTATVEGECSELTVQTDIEGLVGLGVYLDSDAGVMVDCMSVRGNSGLAQRKINPAFTAELRRVIDYDLIILEYGTNVLSAEQTDYSSYANALTKVIERISQSYPEADILVLGIGDRGVKEGTDIISMPTCPAMVKAQREAARRTGTHFWDTRQAMGGDRAIVDWNKRRLANSDYVHINHAGGKQLAALFVESLKTALQ